MKNKKQYSLSLKKQAGAAFLIAMVVLASVAVFYLMGQFGAVSQKQVRQGERVASLATAKKALIAYAINYVDSNPGEMGFLPCPTTGVNPTEGVQDPSCGAVNINTVGRLPWRSLDLPPQFDESNECLWYAVSGYYKNWFKTEMLNDDTNGMLQIYNADGNAIYESAEDRVVAVVIAPNTAVQNQLRNIEAGTDRCRGNYTVTNYLDDSGGINNGVFNGNADQADSFIKAGTNSTMAAMPFNDLIITITRDEIWNAIKRRNDFTAKIQGLTEEIARCLTVYANATTKKNLPWPVGGLDLSTTDYREDGSYIDMTSPASYFGRLPNVVTASEAQLLANGGTGGSGDLGGATVIGPPDCSQCKKKYDKYLEELGEEIADFRLDNLEAQADYQTCLADPSKTQAECDADLVDDLAKAQAKFDKELAKIAADELLEYTDCLAKQSCTSNGGGAVADCTSCQDDYDAAFAKAQAEKIKDEAKDLEDYNKCIGKAKGDAGKIADCDEEYADDQADTQEDYTEDVAEAQAIFDVCSSANSCSGTDGSKGINFVLFDPADPGAASNCLATTEQMLWKNWKDHFFYAVSGNFSPDEKTDVTCTTGGDCVSVGGVNRAGVVIFSGERLAGVTRNDPVASDALGNADTDSKNDILNYLEGSNATNHPDTAGSGAYSTGAGNDYMVCINENAAVDGVVDKAVCQ